MSSRSLTDADYRRLLAFRIELRRFLRHSEVVATGTGLTPALHQLLLAIRGSTQPGGSNIAAIAEALDVRHHTAVEIAQRAEHLGLITRTRDERDHRQIHLQLTDSGATSLETLSRRHLPAIAQLAERLAHVIAANAGPAPGDQSGQQGLGIVPENAFSVAPSHLDNLKGEGPLWGIASNDLNATLLSWAAGDGVAEHTNDELDVLLVVTAGGGTVTVDGRAHRVRPQDALLIKRGARRGIRAARGGMRYLSIHRRRAGLQIETRQPRRASQSKPNSAPPQTQR
ncbi:MAG TPA: MarR family transcriptional regulator [Solirubrobacteraceae bacterium]|jgi:DNA-binding MarR family transcriptional regulator